MMHHKAHLPCLHCHPHRYITMVQKLIERCLLFHMTREDCIRALTKHASILPVVTITVWEELAKENKGFFQTYNQAISPWRFNHRQNDLRVFNLRRRRPWR
ncbi:uncharacterized protein LOC130787873 [Actinidia eriantha]|uniref:uncharacterized protein LOC130787873 n=1 Tax=Actinidia eriantha TaxID=165200 RepID=UPI00258DC74F|nr:uncharacterized protein LOC130787873 [Actinidia eriantha]